MSIIEHILRIITPYDCLGCGDEGALMCKRCASQHLEKLPERCYRCYRLTPGSITCQTCRQHSVLKAVYVRSSYTSLARDVIHKLKFNYARDAAKLIAVEIYRVLPSLPDNMVITHVPAVTTHIRQRGFDQSALIARELSKLTGLPHINALARLGQVRQVGANSSTRRSQLQGVFRPLSKSAYAGLPVLLIDDVTTTGSTIELAGLCLRQAGAASVSAAAFAQAK